VIRFIKLEPGFADKHREMARLLVVDDEVHIRDSLSAVLRKDGHDVVVAANRSEALAQVNSVTPDLIISDICMDGGDGFGLLETIRNNPRTGTIPFIIITGHPDPSGLTQGIESAADGYIPKPFSLDTLRKAVRSRLGREELLRRDASEIKSQLYRVLQATPDLIGLANPESLELFFLNSAGRKMLQTGENFTRPLTSFFLPAVAMDFQRQALAATTRTGRWSGESVLVSSSGRRIAVQLLLQSHRRHDERIEYISVIARDLTGQNENDRALRASEFRFRCLVDALPDAVVMYGADGKITFCNSRTAEMLGYSPQELLKLTAADLFGGTPPVNSSRETILLRQGRTIGEHKVIGKSGEAIPVSVFMEALDIEGEVLELCIFHDLRERKRIERERQEFEIQLRQAQKLESIGQLAAGIAHEINTPTQYIGDNTRFLKDSFQQVLGIVKSYQEVAAAALSEDLSARLQAIRQEANEIDLSYLLQEIPSAIDQSLEGIDRVTRIVRAMKDFSHPNCTEKSAIDINNAIESTLTVARNEWKYVAELETSFDTTLPPIPCLPGEFNQVILNLVVNAAHAIADVIKGTEKKGVIHISTASAGDSVEIRIADSGSGIPEAVRPRIFEPFFTTKEVGKGTGQGLAISRSVIVDKHGGWITFESEVGKGTTFIVRLPKNATS
jgi:two-component system, NtrC family, sensor kinase